MLTAIPFLEEYREELGVRYPTFRCIFELLARRGRPVHIVETGTLRKADSFSGDGQSTFLFARFVKEVTGGTVTTIDIDPEAIEVCKKATANYADVMTHTVSDSIDALKAMPPEKIARTDLFYLDSMDLEGPDFKTPMLHHLKELAAIFCDLGPEALVMTDDNLLATLNDGRQIRIAKGQYIREFLESKGWQMLTREEEYQWIFAPPGFTKA